MEPETNENTDLNKTTPRRVRKSKPASYVTFSEQEHQKISDDSKVSGKSIPTLLKTAYFSGRRVHVLMSQDDQSQWFRELRYWGNRLNQISERMNSGLREGWYPEFALVKSALDRIEQAILGVYGSR